jgi:RNA polymerase sigma-70 factor (sigma-E family)
MKTSSRTVLLARGGNADDRANSVIRSALSSEGPTGFDLAFDGLYRLAYRVAFRMLGDRGDAEDVAQEALARAALRWNRLEDRPEGWVTRVASNLAIDRIRRRGRTLPHVNRPLGLVDPHIGERGDLVNGLRRLPRRQREAVVLRYLADFSEADVAVVMHCSEGTVKSHCSRGLAALRRSLSDYRDGGDEDVRASR